MGSRLHPFRNRREAERKAHLTDVLDVCDALLTLAESHLVGRAPFDSKAQPVCEMTGVLSFTSGTRRVVVRRGETPKFPDPIQQTTQMYVRVQRDAAIFSRLPEREQELLGRWFDLGHDVLLSCTSPSRTLWLSSLGSVRSGSTYVKSEELEQFDLTQRAESIANRMKALQQKQVKIPWGEMFRLAAQSDMEQRRKAALQPRHRTAIGEMLDL